MGHHAMQGENAWVFVPEDAMQDTVKHYFKFEDDLFTEAKKVAPKNTEVKKPTELSCVVMDNRLLSPADVSWFLLEMLCCDGSASNSLCSKLACIFCGLTAIQRHYSILPFLLFSRKECSLLETTNVYSPHPSLARSSRLWRSCPPRSSSSPPLLVWPSSPRPSWPQAFEPCLLSWQPP
jgi:hypothetical protein